MGRNTFGGKRSIFSRMESADAHDLRIRLEAWRSRQGAQLLLRTPVDRHAGQVAHYFEREVSVRIVDESREEQSRSFGSGSARRTRCCTQDSIDRFSGACDEDCAGDQVERFAEIVTLLYRNSGL